MHQKHENKIEARSDFKLNIKKQAYQVAKSNKGTLNELSRRKIQHVSHTQFYQNTDIDKTEKMKASKFTQIILSYMGSF